MTMTQRLTVLAGLAAGLLVDIVAYHQYGELRAVLTRQHWILYLYLGAGVAVGVGGTVHAALSLCRRFRRRAVDEGRGSSR